MVGSGRSWQNVLWREWRNSEDREVARRLLDRLLREPIGWLATLVTVAGGAVCGAMGWVLFVLAVGYARVQPARDEWPLVWRGVGAHVALGALAGGVVVAVYLLLLKRVTRLRWVLCVVWQPLDIPGNPRDWRRRLVAHTGFLYGVCGLALLGSSLGWGFALACGLPMWWILFTQEKHGDRVFHVLRAARWRTHRAFLGLPYGAIWGTLGGALVWLLFLSTARANHDLGYDAPAVVWDAAVAAGGAYALLGLLVFGPAHKAIALSCDVPAHAQEAVIAFADASRPLLLWWTPRPRPCDLEVALRVAGESEWAQFFHRLGEWRAQGVPPDELVRALSRSTWYERLAARHALVSLGGEGIVHLEGLLRGAYGAYAQRVAAWIVRSIGRDTAARLAPHLHAHVCPRCLARCHTHWVTVPGQRPVAYYGCRSCRQTREFLFAPEGVVAVLDRRMSVPVLPGRTLYVNWHARRAVFDFDRVEIRDADDDDVERFCIQIREDTDEVRRRHYRSVRCAVWLNCEFSENTWRILNATFASGCTLVQGPGA